MDRPRLIDRVREEIRVRHYSLRTEKSYIQWIRRFILFHDKRHPLEMGEKEISAYLSHLAINRKVSASTQNQALSAILFLYQKVLDQPLDWLTDVVRAKRPRRLPVVLNRTEVTALLNEIRGINALIARALYGTGMRQMECLRLRVKDLDFNYRQIHIRAGKGNKDRVTVLPDALVEPLARQIETAHTIHQRDLKEGFGETRLLMPLLASIRMPGTNGVGNLYSLPPVVPGIPVPASSAAITGITQIFTAPSNRPLTGCN